MSLRRPKPQLTAMRTALLLLTLVWTALMPTFCLADSRASVTLAPATEILLANGTSKTIVTATIRDTDGNLVANGTPVQFSTTLGTLDSSSVNTISGTARVTLTSAASDGTAVLTATTFVSGRASTGTASVEFTSDRDLASSTGDARWIEIECPQDLLYSADDKIIQAHGKNGSAHIQYRDIDVTADTLQIDLNSPSLQIMAHNAKLTRGHYTVVAADLIYKMVEGVGTGIVAQPGRHPFQYVALAGPALTKTPMSDDAVDEAIKENQFHFTDISDSHVVVAARSIRVDPQSQLQFRRASIYSDGKRVLSVPYHIMSLTSKALFGQQLVGFNSQGLMLNVPIYYHVSPHSLGTLFVRNAASDGGNPADAIPGAFSSFGQNGTHTGVSIDLLHTYSFGEGRSGSFSLDGLTRSDWTAAWAHNERFNDTTSSNVSMNYTAGRSSFVNYGLNHDFHTFAMTLSASRSSDSGFDGYSFSGMNVQATFNTPARRIAHGPVMEATDFTIAQNNSLSTTPGVPTTKIASSTRSVNFTFSTAALHPDRQMTLSPTVKFGQSWNDQGKSAPTATGTLTLNRTHFASGNLSVGYFWSYDPLLSQSVTSYTDPLTALYASSFQQRMTVNYFATVNKRLSLTASGFYGLTVQSSNLTTGMQYHFSDDLSLGLTVLSDRYGTIGYHETQFSLEKRILGHLVMLDYSTKSRKVTFDLAAPQF
jgi:hypothetical protein